MFAGRAARRALPLLAAALATLVVACAAPPAPPAPTAAALLPGSSSSVTEVPIRPAPTPTRESATATSAPTKAATPTVGPSAALSLQWFGQSTFLLTSSKGTRLLMDPTNAATGYAIQPFEGVDVVTISHEHADHNNLALAPGNPTVIRGLKGGDWASVDQTVKDIRIRAVPTYHDDQKGAQRGKNAVFVLEVDGVRIAHMGDLGHLLTQEQVAILGQVDVMMVPVGGFFTLDATGATKVVEQLSPRVVIPMHFKTPRMSPQWQGGPVDPFLEGKKVESVGTNKLELSRATLPATTTVYLLGYES